MRENLGSCRDLRGYRWRTWKYSEARGANTDEALLGVMADVNWNDGLEVIHYTRDDLLEAHRLRADRPTGKRTLIAITLRKMGFTGVTHSEKIVRYAEALGLDFCSCETILRVAGPYRPRGWERLYFPTAEYIFELGNYDSNRRLWSHPLTGGALFSKRNERYVFDLTPDAE